MPENAKAIANLFVASKTTFDAPGITRCHGNPSFWNANQSGGLAWHIGTVILAVLGGAMTFTVSVAATARYAVDTATLDIALTALAPGQADAVRAARAGRDGWLAGRFALLATRRLEVEDVSVEMLVLQPLR